MLLVDGDDDMIMMAVVMMMMMTIKESWESRLARSGCPHNIYGEDVNEHTRDLLALTSHLNESGSLHKNLRKITPFCIHWIF